MSESTKSSPQPFLENAISGYMANDLVCLQLRDVATAIDGEGFQDTDHA